MLGCYHFHGNGQKLKKKVFKKKVVLLSGTGCGTFKNIKLIFQQTLSNWRSSASYMCMGVP